MSPDASMTSTAAAPEGAATTAGAAEAAGSLINDAALQEPSAVEREALRAVFSAEQQATWQKDIAQWRQDAENDADLGGPNLGASVARARNALQRFDPDRRVAQWLDQSGLGNHVEVLRFFNRIARAFGDDGVAAGRPAAGSGLSLEERMYPNWKP